MSVSFHVPGVPVPQGSKTLNRYGGMREANPKHKAWRATVAQAAALYAKREPISGPIVAEYLFVFEAPKSRPKTQFKANGFIPHTTKPDLDKLARSVGDSISDTKTGAHLIGDDSAICRLTLEAVELPNSGWPGVYPATGLEPGVYVTIWERAEYLAPVKLEGVTA